MNDPPPVRRLPWNRIILLLAIAAIAAWIVGFLAGTVVRLLYGF